MAGAIGENNEHVRRGSEGLGHGSGLSYIVDDRLALCRRLRSRCVVRQVDHVDVRLGLLRLRLLRQHRRGGLLQLLLLGLGRCVPRGFLGATPKKRTDIRRHAPKSTVPNAMLPPALPLRPPRSGFVVGSEQIVVRRLLVFLNLGMQNENTRDFCVDTLQPGNVTVCMCEMFEYLW